MTWPGIKPMTSRTPGEHSTIIPPDLVVILLEHRIYLVGLLSSTHFELFLVIHPCSVLFVDSQSNTKHNKLPCLAFGQAFCGFLKTFVLLIILVDLKNTYFPCELPVL